MKFIIDFLMLDLGDYKNFGISFPIGIFIALLFLAMCCSFFVINYRKMYTSELLRKLIRHEAFSEEKAKTLDELHMNRASIRAALSRSGQLTFLVRRVAESRLSYEEYREKSKKSSFKEEKINFSEAKFYLDPDKIKRAENEIANGSGGWWQPIVLTLVCLLVFIILALFGADILSAINNSAAA